MLPKYLNVNLSNNLHHHEFQCKCGNSTCINTVYDTRLMIAYDEFRKKFNDKVTITSGYRCEYHNRNVGGVTDSHHTLGAAMDIAIPKDKKDYFIECAKKTFPYVQVYEKKNFIHVDMRTRSYLHES